MTTDVIRRKSIDSIRTLPTRLLASVQNLDDSQLDTPYGPGKWTVRQVVHHLADAHMHAFVRMKSVLTEDHPRMTEYGQNEYAECPDTKAAPIGSSLQILYGLHSRWTVFLEHLSDSDWARSGVHFRRGEMTLHDMVVHYAKHGETHLGQITDLCNAQGW